MKEFITNLGILMIAFGIFKLIRIIYLKMKEGK